MNKRETERALKEADKLKKIYPMDEIEQLLLTVWKKWTN